MTYMMIMGHLYSLNDSLVSSSTVTHSHSYRPHFCYISGKAELTSSFKFYIISRTYFVMEISIAQKPRIPKYQIKRCHFPRIHIWKERLSHTVSFKKIKWQGHLGGSVGWASDFGSGHDLTACKFEPCIRLCAHSSESGACFGLCLPLSAPPPLALCLSKIKH